MPALIPPETLHTERLLLRRPEMRDAPAMFDGWAQDIEALRYLSWQPHGSVAQAEAHVARCEAAWLDGSAYIHFLVERATNRVVGSLASRVDEHGVNFGYVLRRDGWGRGFMAEALRPVSTWWLEQGGAYRTWATCHTANVQSVRVLEKAGFTLEGTLRRWGLNPNVSPDPCDHFCYSRVRGAS